MPQPDSVDLDQRIFALIAAGNSYDATAAALGLPSSTVRGRLARARRDGRLPPQAVIRRSPLSAETIDRIVALRETRNLSSAEIAAELGLPVGTVMAAYWRASKARQQ